MTEASRRTRFEERVRIERDFLRPVNAIFGKTAPLAGMTGDAIESWEHRAGLLSTEVDVAGVARVLVEASRRAELLADNSRDVFEKGRLVAADGLGTLKHILEGLLLPGVEPST